MKLMMLMIVAATVILIGVPARFSLDVVASRRRHVCPGESPPGTSARLQTRVQALEFFEDVRTRWVAGPLADAYFGVCGPGGAAGAPRRRRAGRPGAGSRGPGRLQPSKVGN